MATFEGTAVYDAYYYKDDAVYGTTHDAGSADSQGPLPEIGQTFELSTYAIYRSGLHFDTSALSASDVINSGSLSLYGFSDNSTTDFNIIVVSGTDLAVPRALADYGDLLDDTIGGGTISSSGWSLTSYNVINLNATGLGWIVKGGTTRLGLRSSRDISSTTPTNPEWVECYGMDAPEAKLNIEYSRGFIPKVVIM